MKLRVTLAERHDLPNGETALKLQCRDTNNDAHTLVVSGNTPHFYALPEQYQQNADAVEYNPDVEYINTSPNVESVYGDSLVEIGTRNSSDVPEVASTFEDPYASDVYYHHRCRIDLGIETGIEVPDTVVKTGEGTVGDITPVDFTEPDYRVLNADIEVSDRNGFPDVSDADSPILSIVVHDSYSERMAGFVLMGERDPQEVWPSVADGEAPGDLDLLVPVYDEQELLTQFANFVNRLDPDIVTGWNAEQFDYPYIVNRMHEKNVDANALGRGSGSVYVNERNGSFRTVIPGRQVVDMLSAYKTTKFTEKDSYRLDDVAADEIGAEKLKFEGGFHDFYERDLATFLEYNIRDVSLTVELNETCDIFGFMDNLQQEIGCEFGDTMYPKDMMPFAVRKICNAEGVVPPTGGSDSRDYEGAHVFEPEPGVHTNVVGIDLASLYPNTIVMGNLSPEKKVQEGGDVTIPGLDVSFSLEGDGIFAKMCRKYLSLKSDLKERKKQLPADHPEKEAVEERYNVTKVVVNSIYGLIGYRYFFWYDADTAEAVTLLGQSAIKATAQFIEEETQGTVIYGDTDSCYISFPPSWEKEKCQQVSVGICQELNNEVYPALAEDHGIPEEQCRWSIEPEDFISRFFSAGKKKRYALTTTAEWSGEDLDSPSWSPHEPSTTIKGFEYKRSDTAPLTAQLQKSVLQMIMRGEDESDIRNLVRDTAQSIPDSSLDEIGIPQGMKKSVPFTRSQGQKENYYAWSDNYGAPQDAHPRGVYNADALGVDTTTWSKPKRIYTDPSRSGGYDVLCFTEPEELDPVSDKFVTDIQKMTDKLVIDPVETILEAVGIDVQAAVSGQSQKGLEEYL